MITCTANKEQKLSEHTIQALVSYGEEKTNINNHPIEHMLFIVLLDFLSVVSVEIT